MIKIAMLVLKSTTLLRKAVDKSKILWNASDIQSYQKKKIHENLVYVSLDCIEYKDLCGTYVTQILTLYLSEFLMCEIEQIQEFHSVALFFHGIKLKLNQTNSH